MEPSDSIQAPSECSFCGSRNLVARGVVPQYVEGSKAHVWECLTCLSQSATIEDSNTGPQSAEGLYDAIYSQSKRLKGYDRYHRYVRIVRRSRKGMRNLALCEDVYWAVAKTVRSIPKDRPLRVMEVASGLGYLTAALRSMGIEAYGIDVSEIAVIRATEAFGPWYSVANVFAQDDWPVSKPDLIIALELIEHLDQPATLINQLTARLPPQGQLLISTPNRDMSPSEAIWQTDLPPVHVHWISEVGLISAAQSTNCNIEFVDFSRFNRWSHRKMNIVPSAQVLEPFLNTAMQPIKPSSSIRERLLSSRIAPILQFSYRHIFGLAPGDRRRSGSLVAKYTRKSID